MVLWIRCWGGGVGVVVLLSLSSMLHPCHCPSISFSFASLAFQALSCFLPSLNSSPNLPITSSVSFAPVRSNIVLSHPIQWMYSKVSLIASGSESSIGMELASLPSALSSGALCAHRAGHVTRKCCTVSSSRPHALHRGDSAFCILCKCLFNAI